jgi:ADP-heptose:LPS heptosyltransferase
MFESLRWLREQNFDWVIDLQCLARSGAFAWLANGKFLIGLDEVREGARGFYDLAVRRASFHTHAVDWYLAVLPHLGVPVHGNFQWLPERPQIAAEIKRKWLGETERRPPARRAGSETGAPPARVEPGRTPDSELRTPNWIAIQPGARWSNKRWPVEYFTALIRLLAARFSGVRFAILGGGEDQPLGEIVSLAEPERCLNLCGRTSLLEMVEWVRLCDLMITNDTGPMHVAAALGKPLVALFGPTEPRRTGPYHQLDDVLRIDLPCSPCLKSHCAYVQPNECLNALSPAAVFEFACKKLQG